MATSASTTSVEAQIDRWRGYVRRRQAIHAVDVAELEDHLREQVAMLMDAGLDADEAFLIAVKRLGSLDALSREFAREHSDRLWKQLVVVSAAPDGAGTQDRRDAVVAACLAAAAAVLVKVPALFGLDLYEDAGFYRRNLSLFVLPVLTGYFAWKRRLPIATLRWLILAFAGAAVLVNVYPFERNGATELLAALHLPIALWLVVGISYAGARWREVAGRMDFVRFSGELFIYGALIALGSFVLAAFAQAIFEAIGIRVDRVFESWLAPCGAAAAVIVAARLVEAKQSVIENMAPVLTRLFTPIVAAVLLAFLGALLWTGRGDGIDRDMLVVFDVLLLLVLGLLLYALSARDPHAPPGAFDAMQVVLVVSALVADAVALWAIAARITEFGLSPNRIAVLGLNAILLVNLAWSAVLYARFLGRRGSFASLERWQTDYLTVHAAWAAIVALAFPPLFGYA